jgi:hypothetical protein
VVKRRKPKPRAWARHDTTNKTRAFACRLRETTYQALEKAAARNGLTLSAQAEASLAESLAAGRPTRTEALMLLIGIAIDSVCKMEGTPWIDKDKPPPADWRPADDAAWWNDSYLYEEARATTLAAFDLFKPKGRALTPEQVELAGGTGRGKIAVDVIVNDARLLSPDTRPRATSVKKRQYQQRLLRIQAGFGRLLAKPEIFGSTAQAALERHNRLTESERTEFLALAGRITAQQFAVEAAEQKAGRRLTEQDIDDFLPDDPEQRRAARGLTPEERARFRALFDKAGIKQ